MKDTSIRRKDWNPFRILISALAISQAGIAASEVHPLFQPSFLNMTQEKTECPVPYSERYCANMGLQSDTCQDMAVTKVDEKAFCIQTAQQPKNEG